MKGRFLPTSVILALLSVTAAHAEERTPKTAADYASKAQGKTYCVSPNGSGTNRGTRKSPWSLKKANTSAQPGDVIVLLDGTYAEQIAPVRSGKNGRRIVYCAANTRKAVLNAGYPAIDLAKRSYITVSGIMVDKVRRYIEGSESHHITITNCRFENAHSGTFTKCRFFNCGDRIHFTNNYIKDGGDLLTIGPGNNHLIENNYFGSASHTGLVLHGVQNSVVRNNSFTNAEWKCMEVFSAWKKKDTGRRSRHNLIEKNRFDYTSSSCIQYAGCRNILRRNVFRLGRTGMNWANYLGSAKNCEAWYNEGNRFYNNVIVDCGGGEQNRRIMENYKAKGLKVAEKYGNGYAMTFATNLKPGSDSAYGDQTILNNIIYRNRSAKGDKRTGSSVQITFDWDCDPTPSLCSIRHNLIMCDRPGENVFWWCDGVYAKPKMPQSYTLKAFERTFPKIASNNIERDPRFVDIDKGDFHLRPGSPCIDAGTHLTVTTSGGKNSTKLSVKDATFFTDGYGLIEPDVIRVGSEKVTIKKADYDTNLIVLDRPISWKQGTRVSLDHNGRAPDIGAFEFGN